MRQHPWLSALKALPGFLLLLLTSCVTVPEGGYVSQPTSRTFNASFDKTWGAIVSELSSVGPVKVIDKASGLLSLEPVSISSSGFAQLGLEKYAYAPPNLLGTWSLGRALISVYAASAGKGTMVRVTAKFAGFEDNVTHEWMEWPTKGVLENTILDRIANDLGTHS
jgi:hypothetical protein